MKWFLPRLLLAAAFSSLFMSLAARAEDDPVIGSSEVTPPLKWKYGWKDGRKANTVGSFRGRDVLPAASAPLSSGYSPVQIASAYGFNLIPSTGDGRGQTIAIVDAYGSPTIQSDLNVFCQQYGLPATSVSVVYPQGQPSTVNSGWAAETMLDVEWAYAMAPGAKIVVVVAKDATLGNLLGAVNYAYTTVHATVVSMSWGATEFSTEKNYDSYFNHPGTSYVAASGDAGSIVDWPAVSSYVLGVGGTSLVYDSLSATVTSETGWSGSGGGISKYVQIPSYQVGFNNNAGRGVPDVSYDADPYTGFNVYLTDPGTNLGGWYVYGGTSAGAPQWAALLARRASLGNGGSTLINTVLYSASKTNYPGLFRDITSGSSGLPAVTGYDLVTGLGSPLADKIAALAYPTASASPSPSASARPSASPSPTPTPTRGKR